MHFYEELWFFLPQNFEGTISSDIQWSGWCVDLNVRGAANHQHRGWRDHGDGRSSPTSAWPESHRPSGGHHREARRSASCFQPQICSYWRGASPFETKCSGWFCACSIRCTRGLHEEQSLGLHGCCTMQDHRWSLFGLEEWPPYCPTRSRRFAMNWYPGPGDVCWLINPNYSYTVVL